MIVPVAGVPLGPPSREMVASVLSTYARAWVEQDPELILAIFTEDAIYHERVLEKPILGHQAIAAYWRTKVVLEQGNITFALLNSYVDDSTVIAEWEVFFDDKVEAVRKHMKEVAILEFRQNKIASLREYWSAEAIGRPQGG